MTLVGRTSPLAAELGSWDHACLLISLGHVHCTSRHRPKVLKKERKNVLGSLVSRDHIPDTWLLMN